MIIKTTYRSHFNLKKNYNKKYTKKQIFVKGIILFLLFSKIFFKNYTLKIRFLKKIKKTTNILKAPSRHKKFFHQVYIEYFSIIFSWFVGNYNIFNIFICIKIFNKINLIFLKIGTNVLTRIKFKINITNNCYIILLNKNLL